MVSQLVSAVQRYRRNVDPLYRRGAGAVSCHSVPGASDAAFQCLVTGSGMQWPLSGVGVFKLAIPRDDVDGF